MAAPAEERRVASRRAEDQKRDIPRTLTILILVMMVLSVGGVVENQVSKSHLRDQQHRATQAAIARSTAIARNAQQLALRVKTDEELLFQLIVSVSKARSPHDVKKAIHTFIRKSRKVDSEPLPGVPPTTMPSLPASPSAYHPIAPSSSDGHRTTRPRNTHPPPKSPHKHRHHPSAGPLPTPPQPVPTQLCITILGPIICKGIK